MEAAEFAERLAQRMAAVPDSPEPEATPAEEPGSDTVEIDDDGNETPAAGQREIKRDPETGRFVGQEQAEEEQDEEQAEEQSEEEEDGSLLPERAQSVLEKYGDDPEKIAAAYAALERKLGEQGKELGVSRSEMDRMQGELQELRQAVEQRQPESATEQYPVTPELLEWADEQAIENPKEAALWALKNQPAIYDRILDGWYENEPGEARRFERVMLMEAVRTEMSETLRPVVEPLTQARVNSSFTSAWANVQERYPDLPKFADQILEEAKTVPELASVLQGGEMAAQARVIEHLLLAARGRNTDTLVNERLSAERDARAKAAAKKTAATVATASQSPNRQPADQELVDFRREFRKAAGLEGVMPE